MIRIRADCFFSPLFRAAMNMPPRAFQKMHRVDKQSAGHFNHPERTAASH
jgi:hypothetical protein